MDTGFDGDLALPPAQARELDIPPTQIVKRALANGSIIACPVIETTIAFDDESQDVQILVLPGNPLLGNTFLANCLIQIEIAEGGEVTIEPL